MDLQGSRMSCCQQSVYGMVRACGEGCARLDEMLLKDSPSPQLRNLAVTPKIASLLSRRSGRLGLWLGGCPPASVSSARGWSIAFKQSLLFGLFPLLLFRLLVNVGRERLLVLQRQRIDHHHEHT